MATVRNSFSKFQLGTFKRVSGTSPLCQPALWIRYTLLDTIRNGSHMNSVKMMWLVNWRWKHFWFQRPVVHTSHRTVNINWFLRWEYTWPRRSAVSVHTDGTTSSSPLHTAPLIRNKWQIDLLSNFWNFETWKNFNLGGGERKEV